MTGGIADAAAAVEPDALDSDPDPGAGDSEQNVIGETEGAADPDLGDLGADPDPSFFERLMQPMEGSIREDRVGDLWNPEQGGLNRLVLALEESAGMSDGLPRIVHVPIALGELYVKHADQLGDLGGEQDEQDDQLTVDPNEI